jgi:hypothetical protein
LETERKEQEKADALKNKNKNAGLRRSISSMKVDD